MRTSPLAKQLAEEDAKRPPPEPTPGNGQSHANVPQQPQGPRYEFWRPWYKNLLAKGCARCGGTPQGWVQQQISTPYRTKRLILWAINLVPRLASFISVILSRKVGLDQYGERQASCAVCPGEIIQLRIVKDEVRETTFCALCSCPKWFGSRLSYKNRKTAHLCPIKRHSGSNPDQRLVSYIATKALEGVEGTEV